MDIGLNKTAPLENEYFKTMRSLALKETKHSELSYKIKTGFG